MARKTRPLPGGDWICVYSTYADKDTPNADYLTYLTIKRARSGLPPARYEGVADGPPIEARVDLGRWLVGCEDCGSAVVVEPDIPVFLCPTCGVDGLWRPVIIPTERVAIEEILLLRPGFREANRRRFWLPGETVAILVDENLEHGTPIPAQHEAAAEARKQAKFQALALPMILGGDS